MSSPQRVYFDHAATTPMFPEAIEAMTAALGRVGNPSSLHASGRDARRAVEEAREQVAAALRCRPGEVVFTSGGTESDNLAVKGLYWARRVADPRRRRIIGSAIEHHAVLDPLDWLAKEEQAEVELIGVDHEARIDVEAFRRSIEREPESVALVTVMLANNEVGTVQPVAELAAICRAHGIPIHTDAVQAVGQLEVDFADLGVDALTLTGHKVGGPFGVGALVVRRDLALTALIHGGGQERDIRSGTLDTPAIVGLATALDLAVRRQPIVGPNLAARRQHLIDAVQAVVPDAVANGDPVNCLPGNAHLTFPGCEGDALLMLLDAKGIECSTGSACNAGVAQPSHVLLAMGRTDEEARSSLRFSLGHTSTAAEIETLAAAIGPAVDRARAAGVLR